MQVTQKICNFVPILFLENKVMADINEALQELSSRVEQLISLHEQMRAAYGKICADKQRCDLLIEEQAKTIAELEEKNQALLLGGALVQTSGGSSEAKREIDKIVREIDRCILLFNKQTLQ